MPHENTNRLRIHLVVEVDRIGPVAESRSTVVTALIRACRERSIVWAGVGIKQTAYKVVSVQEEQVTTGVR